MLTQAWNKYSAQIVRHRGQTWTNARAPGYNPPFFGKRDSSTSGQTTAISAKLPCGQVTAPQGLHPKCSPLPLPLQL